MGGEEEYHPHHRNRDRNYHQHDQGVDPDWSKERYASRMRVNRSYFRDLYSRSPSPCPVDELYGGMFNKVTALPVNENIKNEYDNSEDEDKEDSSSSDFGPQPLEQSHLNDMELDYGGALLRGEGAAMAAYVKDGKRIPRRGEIGISTDQIEKFEKLGYVMSGSRHARMNAVRLRKEGQVLSAEEKRLELIANEDARANKEAALITDLKAMLKMKSGRI